MTTPLINIHSHSSAIDGETTIQDIGTARAPLEGLFSVGIHPWHISHDWKQQFRGVAESSKQQNIRAIGECGFDMLKSPVPATTQREVFDAHIALSESVKKPLIIHLVKGQDELLCAKRERPNTQAWVIHGFRGKKEQAQQLINAGFYLSYGEKFNAESVAATPLHRIFVESDESNMPLKLIYSKIAAAKNITIEELLIAVKRNCSIFGI